MGPHFEHDCAACVFLGTHDYDAPLDGGKTMLLQCDLYYCPGSLLGGSIIARHSSKGHEYASTAADLMPTYLAHVDARKAANLPLSTHCEGLVIAYARAKEKGLINFFTTG